MAHTTPFRGNRRIPVGPRDYLVPLKGKLKVSLNIEGGNLALLADGAAPAGICGANCFQRNVWLHGAGEPLNAGPQAEW